MTALRLPLPDDEVIRGACTVIRVLRGAGHEAYVVGGAVRDLARGIVPHEYDVATSARPEAVIALFRSTVPVGVRFGVVRVRIRRREYEVATLRAEACYSDGRRPDSVRFTDLREDVARRDFTMNGLAMDPFTGEVTDFVGGIADIEAGVIRAIGDPIARFGEDRLRPLRAVRFAAQTGFAIEGATYLAIREVAPEVARVSAERVRDELAKVLASARPGLGLGLLDDTGLLAGVLPEVAQAGGVSRAIACLDRVAGAIACPDCVAGATACPDRVAGEGEVAAWAALLSAAGAAAADRAMGRLRHPNRTRRAVVEALRTADAIRGLPLADVAAEKRVLRSDGAAPGLSVLDAWLAAGDEDRAPVRHARARLAEWTRDDLFPARLGTGDDAIGAGVPRGPAVASALAALEDEQLRGRIRTREEAVAFLARRARDPGLA
ncbi:MAG: CCA tRNA nucleotidyltransferase [Deltaproteobacteria bacterium]|nr:CCA tRNA nucleotidyltransferase [Deltaproteobacteria bacterium]